MDVVNFFVKKIDSFCTKAIHKAVLLLVKTIASTAVIAIVIVSKSDGREGGRKKISSLNNATTVIDRPEVSMGSE